MDVNGLPFWQIAGRAAFGLSPASAPPNVATGLHFKDEAGHVLLARALEAPAIAEDETFARLLAAAPSPVADGMGGVAWWDAGERQLKASGFLPGAVDLPLPVPDPPSVVAPTDFALGPDSVLYAARDGAVVMKDLRGRWPAGEAKRDGFRADLVAPRAAGGAWAFDKTTRRLARVAGRPLRVQGLSEPEPSRFAPVDPNRDPPRLILARGGRLPARFDAVALAASLRGRLALLAWEAGADAALFTLEEAGLVLRFRLAGLRFPVSVAWIGEAEAAVLATDGKTLAPQAFVYPLDLAPQADAHLLPDGRVHPLIGALPGKFCNAPAPQPLYRAGESLLPLRGLSGGRYGREGTVLVGPIDSGMVGCVWHRLYVEAAVPAHGTIEIAACARDDRAVPPLPGAKDAPDWAPHRVGAAPQPDGVPRAAWCDAPSEIAFAPPLLACAPQADRAGLFTLLLQRGGTKVRRVTGRYLWLHVRLTGDSQASPELAAMRAYARRFSYRDRYLPAFYREPLGGSDALAPGAATPHDFMERFLGLFEGALTEAEGRIARAFLLTDPAAAPDAALPWLGQWIGVAAQPHDSPARLRQALLAAPYTAGLNGTLGGLAAALELATGGLFVTGGTAAPGHTPPRPGTAALARMGGATLRALALGADTSGALALLAGGAVTRGDIVIVEGFRLRRTFATILGADLSDEQDPLTLGLSASGNSFVGDTLILGDQARDELFALYRPEIDRGRADTEAVIRFYARLAHSVLILVRGIDDPAEMRRLQDVVAEAIPAHVEPHLLQARDPLIVGASALVGVDSWLGETAPIRPVRVGRTVVGRGDQVMGSGGLDPRADGPAAARPIARADGPPQAWSGTGFTISALRSRAAEGRRVERHIWTWE
ncbi:MAG: hypothetical protein JO013_10145 [Alphaproteobacteria bacterium]|nr:hypothetical protein [Alphaproteobacteria bacterium]